MKSRFYFIVLALLGFTISSCTNDGAENPANSAESPDNTGPSRIRVTQPLKPGVYYGDTTVGVNIQQPRDTSSIDTSTMAN